MPKQIFCINISSSPFFAFLNPCCHCHEIMFQHTHASFFIKNGLRKRNCGKLIVWTWYFSQQIIPASCIEVPILKICNSNEAGPIARWKKERNTNITGIIRIGLTIQQSDWLTDLQFFSAFLLGYSYHWNERPGDCIRNVNLNLTPIGVTFKFTFLMQSIALVLISGVIQKK